MPPLRLALVASVLLLFAAPASAITFSVEGQNYGSDVTADVELTWNGTDTLTIEIENTASVSVAIITGFAFNLPFTLAAGVIEVSSFSASGTLDDASWMAIAPSGNAPGSYDFELAGVTGTNIAGGNPQDGFGIGETATFTFVFTGAPGGLTDADFLGEFSAGASGPADFGVRFQSIPTGAGSDFAIHTDVPEPAALLLLLSAIPLGLRRRR